MRSVAGLDVFVTPSAVAWYFGLACLSAVGARRWGASRAGAAAVGLGSSLAHLACLGAHHAGHACGARSSGHPMVGIRLWGPLASDVYPANEPPLPASTHLRRALSGPAASLLLMIVLLWAAVRRRLSSTTVRQWILFTCLDNALVFCVGPFLPLSFTDGGTLREWWHKQ